MNKDVKQYVKKLKKIANKGSLVVAPNKNKLTIKFQMTAQCGAVKNIVNYCPRTPSCWRWKKNNVSYLNKMFSDQNIPVTLNI